MKPIIGIIGGKGKMGSWFRRFFQDRGFKVIVTDLTTRLENRELVKKSDAVIFSVPISRTVEVIESVLTFTREDQILMDLTSIKEPAVNAMLKSKSEVLGMHPMFGPMANSIKGQTIVFCKARERKLTGLFEKLFIKAGATLKDSTPSEHDKLMSVIQCLNHFNSIVLGHTIMRLGIDLEESFQYTSPIYRIKMDMVGRILDQDPRLYAEIEIENPYAAESLKALAESSDELRGLVESRDSEGFINYFKKSSDYFGRFRSRAMDESNYLINRMVEKNER